MGDFKSRLLVVGWCAFLGAFALLAMTDFALIANARWCGSEDEHCLREWIAATSGYAAAGAAAVTLAILLQQLREQRSQTRFLLGESMPTAVARHPEGDFEDIEVRVTNWNRRSIDILRIDVLESSAHTEISYTRAKAPNGVEKFFNTDGGDIVGIVRIPGWENRSEAPPSLSIFCHAETDDRVAPLIDLTLGVRVIAMGEQHAAFVLKAPMILRTGLSTDF